MDQLRAIKTHHAQMSVDYKNPLCTLSEIDAEIDGFHVFVLANGVFDLLEWCWLDKMMDILNHLDPTLA